MDTHNQKTSTTDWRYPAISILFKKHQQLKNYCFNSQKMELNNNAEEILKNATCFSSSEMTLIKIALDIWSGTGGAKVSELIEKLDAQNFSNVLDGLGLLAKQKLKSEEWFIRLVNQADANSRGNDFIEG